MHDALEHTGAAEHDEPGSSAEGEGPPEEDSHPAQPTNTIQIDAGDLNKVDADALCGAIEAALAHLHRDVSRIGLVVVDDEAMTELHRTWHGKDTTTDVLTFETDTDGPIDVDIAVCIDEARRQCAYRGHEVLDELLLYVLHGLLHCCGHNDHTNDDRRRMFEAQDDLLKAIGRTPISEDA